MGVRRLDADWMQQLDERLLEFLDNHGWATPSLIAHESWPSASQARIRERFRWLQYAGFVVPFAGDCYELTTWGKLYLDGEIDASHQPNPKLREIYS